MEPTVAEIIAALDAIFIALDDEAHIAYAADPDDEDAAEYAAEAHIINTLSNLVAAYVEA